MSTTQRPEATVDISLTPQAVEKVKQFIEQGEFPAETCGLRVSVLPGGCSGFRYDLRVDDQPMADDLVKEQDGIRIFIDPFSGQYLQGTQIDYVSSMQASGFAFNNPNATGGCGCGESFSA